MTAGSGSICVELSISGGLSFLSGLSATIDPGVLDHCSVVLKVRFPVQQHLHGLGTY